MKNISETIKQIREDKYQNIDDILYAFNEGIELGKEESRLYYANKLINHNIDLETISKVFLIDIEQLKENIN